MFTGQKPTLEVVLSPLLLHKSGTIIFRANAKFFWQKPAAKNGKKHSFCVY